MIFVWDHDDVLFDFVNPLMSFAIRKKLLPTNFRKEMIYDFDLWKSFNCSPEKSEEILRAFYKSDEFRDLEPNKGMVDVVERASSVARRQYVVSSRPSGLLSITRERVARHFPAMFEEVILTGVYEGVRSRTKAQICLELGATHFIDDKIDNFNGLNGRLYKIVYDQPWN
jgi:hypothetical protein